MRIHFLFIVLVLSSPLFAQPSLKLEEIMQGDQFIGHQPSNHFWSWDGKRVYFYWNPTNEPGPRIYYWEKGFKEAQKLPPDEIADTYLSEKGQYGNEIRYYIRDGALFKFNTKTNKHEKIYHTVESIRNLMFVESSSALYFQQKNNLYKFNTEIGTIEQITNFRRGNVPNKKKSESNYLKTQQQELFAYVRDKQRKNNWNKERNKEVQISFPSAFYFGSYNMENMQISPDEKHVVFRLSKYPKRLETKFVDYLSDDGYSTEKIARKKVSIKGLSKHKLGVYNIERDSVYYIDFDRLAALKNQPSYLSLYHPTKISEPAKRTVVMNEVVFNKSGSNSVLVVRSLDNKDRWIVRLDFANGKIEELEHQHDPAWIGGPGISSWNFSTGTLGFMKDEETIYFQSEESGYSHLYSLHTLTKKKKQLTSGNWEVRKVQLAHDKESFYISANKSHPGNRDLYRLNPNSGNLTPLFDADGSHQVEISPDESQLLTRYSYKNKPWELYLSENKKNSQKKQITHSTSASFESYAWRNPKVIQFKAKDQTPINARIYEPNAGKKNGAAVIFVHGAGYLQNAHNYWSTYHREFMFNNLLADEGYTVLDIDYRASDGYGRDFRTGIYRFMGGADLSDQLDGRQLLINDYKIDSSKIGIYGGSYGGFITLMALLNHPGKFKCGAALRSVTDWAHYNLGYTSNILNFPETDPEAYRKSSPIYFADQLKDHLLMLHGVNDNNVQFQDVVRLSQRFIETGKKNWELALFPIEAHGFKKTTSWIDEYRRIHELFNSHLK